MRDAASIPAQRSAQDTSTVTAWVQLVVMGVALGTVLALIAWSLLSGVQAEASLTVYLGAAAFCVVGLLLVRRGRGGLVNAIFSLCYWAFTSGSLFLLGGLHNPAVGGAFVTTLIVAGLFWGGRGALIVGALDSVALAGLLVAHHRGLVPEIPGGLGVQHWVELTLQIGVVAALAFAMLRAIDRSRAETAAQHAQLLALIEQNPDGIVLLADDGEISRLNRAAQDLLGSADLVGSALADLSGLSPEGRHRIRDAVQAREGDVLDVERVIGDRTVAMEWRFGPVDSPLGTVLGTLRDVTDKKREQVLRQQLEARADEARHLEALGRLAGGVAHDFNNLLSVIMGHAEMAMLDPRADATKSLHGILDTAQHGAALTSQMLAFGRQRHEASSAVDVVEVLSGMRRLLDRLLESSVELHVELPDEPVWVCQGRSSLEQIVLNLVTNARDSVGEAGHIWVSLTVVDAPPHAGDPSPGPQVSLRVRDDGVGMDEQTRRRIFEPFFTTKRMGQGTGLGLATVHGIVTRGGGYIDVVSAPGEGSTFRVLLPTCDGPSEPVVDSAQPTTEMPPLSILVAEDEAALRDLLVTMLQRQGHTVSAADDGSGAWALFEQAGGGFDVVVTDIVMKSVGGFELADRLRASQPDLPILFISGYAPDLAARLPEGGVLLSKPFDAAALYAAIERVWTHGAEGVEVVDAP